MQLISTHVEIGLSSNTIVRYENLGYNIPKHWGVSRSRYVVKRGTKIVVDVNDLPVNSNHKVKVKCLDCGNEYLQQWQWYIKSTTDYCRDCNTLKNRKTSNIEGLRFHRLVAVKNTGRVNNQGNYIWHCQCDCGNTKEVPATYLKEKLVQSCGCLACESSLKNMKKLRATQGTGINSPTWNPLLTSKDRDRTRAYDGYKQFHKAALKRDEYTCQVCKRIGGNLTVHHIISYSKNPELRTKEDNGITLCKKCHYGVHRGAKMEECNKTSLDKFIKITKLADLLQKIEWHNN